MASEHRSKKPSQEVAFASSRADRANTLEAVLHLERAAAAAAAGREVEWLNRIRAELQALAAAVAIEQKEAEQPDSLLAMIARDYPRRFGSRIRQLREQHEDVVRTIASLLAQIEASLGEPPDVTDLRQRLGWLTEAMRHRWARESDLVYEAIRLDLGRGSA